MRHWGSRYVPAIGGGYSSWLVANSFGGGGLTTIPPYMTPPSYDPSARRAEGKFSFVFHVGRLTYMPPIYEPEGVQDPDGGGVRWGGGRQKDRLLIRRYFSILFWCVLNVFFVYSWYFSTDFEVFEVFYFFCFLLASYHTFGCLGGVVDSTLWQEQVVSKNPTSSTLGVISSQSKGFTFFLEVLWDIEASQQTIPWKTKSCLLVRIPDHSFITCSPLKFQ